MANVIKVDLESIFQPIGDDAPSGTDVRDDPSPTSDYQTIKAARNAARALERQNIDDSDSQEAMSHWRNILDLAPEVLKNQAKDLEVACWYTEASVRLHGFAGLRDALLIISGLLERFWDDLHPMPDEYGLETRVSCVAGLNGEGAEGVLIAPLRKVPLTEGYDPGPYSLWQYVQASDLQKIQDDEQRNKKIESLGFDLDAVNAAVNGSSTEFYVDLRDALEECIAAIQEVGQLLDDKCGIHEAPSIRTIKETLDECLGTVNHLAKYKFPSDALAEGEFRKTEPHSPVSYVLQKAVKWGSMSLEHLINELIPDSTSREHYSELTGVNVEETE